MHDSTARILHDDRVSELRQEADAYRLARQARDGTQLSATRRLIGFVQAQVGRVVIPRRTASAAASTRPETSSLARMLDT